MMYPRGLPAISDDGRFVAAAAYEVSRSLQIIVIEVESVRVLEEIHVFGSEEIKMWERENNPSYVHGHDSDHHVADEVDQNVRRANRLLRKRRYTPMATASIERCGVPFSGDGRLISDGGRGCSRRR